MSKRKYHGSTNWRDGILHGEFFQFLRENGALLWEGPLPPLKLLKEFARRHRLGMPALKKQLRAIKTPKGTGAWGDAIRARYETWAAGLRVAEECERPTNVTRMEEVEVTITGGTFVLRGKIAA